jgi:hypothetical protein
MTEPSLRRMRVWKPRILRIVQQIEVAFAVFGVD